MADVLFGGQAAVVGVPVFVGADQALLGGDHVIFGTEPVIFGASPAPIYDARKSTFIVAEFDTSAGDTLCVSDVGYRTSPGDAGGVRVYAGRLDQVFQIDRRLGLDPASANTQTYGAVSLTNLGSKYDAYMLARNNDSRAVRLLIGQKQYDTVRGIYLDPSYSDLQPFFTGAGSSWIVGEDAVTIPLKDQTYLIDTPLQSKFYGGSGGLDGVATLAGKAIPMTRGGSAASPVLNVSPLLVDPVLGIYQWTDGPGGTVVALYEAGAAVFAYAGDVADLTAGQTPPGEYRTCNALGLFQLGSPTAATITADVTGPGGPTAIGLLLYMLLTDMAFPVASIDAAALSAADLLHPYVAGFYTLNGTDTGLQLATKLAASIGGRLVSSRSGLLSVYVLAPLPTGAVPAASFSVTNAVSVVPIALTAALDPPPWKWQVGYGANYTVQTSGLNPTTAPARLPIIAVASSYATWTNYGVKNAWKKAGVPAVVDTFLLRRADALTVAIKIGAQWGTRPGYYTLVVPLGAAAGLSIGSIVKITWPLNELRNGAIGQIVGEQTRSTDAIVTFEVLINSQTVTPDGDFSSEFSKQFSGGMT